MNSRIKLLSVIGVSSAALVPFFVQHYRRFGVQQFCLTLHYAEGQESERDLALSHLREAGVEAVKIWAGPFEHEKKEHYLASMRENYSEGNDWWVYADTDEFHEFPVRLGFLREECERTGKRYVMGRWIDRLAEGGALRRIDPKEDLYGQFPWATHLSLSLGGKSFDATTKLCFVADDVFPSNSGFHRPADRHWRDDPDCWPGLIATNHFKWDLSVRQRLKCRVTEWADVPNSVREAQIVAQHIEAHNEHIDLESVSPRQRQADGTPLRRKILRGARYAKFALDSRILGQHPEFSAGKPDALFRRWGIYR